MDNSRTEELTTIKTYRKAVAAQELRPDFRTSNHQKVRTTTYL